MNNEMGIAAAIFVTIVLASAIVLILITGLHDERSRVYREVKPVVTPFPFPKVEASKCGDCWP